MPYSVNVDNGELEFNMSAAALGAITDITADVGALAPVAGVVIVTGGTGINTAGAGNTLTISLDGDVAMRFDADTGTATPAAGLIRVWGGTSISTTAAGSTITINLEPASIDINSLTGFPLTVPHGGTGTTLVQPFGVMTTGSTGTGALGSVQLDSGEIVIGVTGGLSVAASPTNGNNITWTLGAGSLRADVTGLTQNAMVYGSAAGAITSLGVATNGQIPIGSTANPPVLATLTAGAGIGITNAAGSITITNTAGGFAWSRVAGVAQALAPQNGYVSTNGALTTFTLPAIAALGESYVIAGEGTGLWAIAQNAGQQIHVGVLSSTAGVAGGVTATHRRDVIELVCTVANTEFLAVDFVGNLGVT